MPAVIDTRCENEAREHMVRDTSPGVRSGDAARGAEFEGLLTSLLALFASTPWQQLGAAVDRALDETLGFCAVDQVCLIEVLPDRTEAVLRYAAGTAALPTPPERFSYDVRFPWIFRKTVLAAETVAITARDELPAEAAADRESMQAFAQSASLHIPLQVDGEVRFVLTAAYARRPVVWTEQCVTRLKALGATLVLAISRSEAVGTLQASQHNASDTLQASHLGRWEWDIGADKLHLSDEAKHIFGADVPDLAHLIRLVQPADRARVERAIKRSSAHPGVRLRTQYAIRTPAGEMRAIQQWHQVIFPGERTGRLVATVLDASAMQKAEQEMVQLREHQWHSVRVAQTALLVASLAHELSQPLTAILNNAQAGLRFLKNDALSPEDMQEILTDIVASNKRASEVLSALRAMLRRQNTTRITFDAADAVNDVLGLVRSELMSELIEVKTSLASACYLSADKTQIEQVLLNLVMNSIDAMRGRRDGKQCLELSLFTGDGGEVQLAVKDSGRGIPTEQFAKVFEAFWTTKKKGLGIGLPVCRAIVESYRGRIWCENNDADGVTFRLILPSAEQQP